MIFEWEGDKIDVVPALRKASVIIALREWDKSARKTYYHRALNYVYFVYSPDSPYKEYYLSVRKSKFCVDILKKGADCWEKIEGHKEVKDLIEWYKDVVMTVEERMVADVDEDIDNFVKHLSSIPYVKANGEDNIDTKLKAIKASKELLTLKRELRAMLKGKKAKENKKKVRTRLFEV